MDITYSEKLKHPLWQKKRLEVMQADNFTCQICFSKERALNVHHKKYIVGCNPWEYKTNELITICEDCHLKYHKEVTIIQFCSRVILKNLQ